MFKYSFPLPHVLLAGCFGFFDSFNFLSLLPASNESGYWLCELWTLLLLKWRAVFVTSVSLRVCIWVRTLQFMKGSKSVVWVPLTACFIESVKTIRWMFSTTRLHVFKKEKKKLKTFLFKTGIWVIMCLTFCWSFMFYCFLFGVWHYVTLWLVLYTWTLLTYISVFITSKDFRLASSVTPIFYVLPLPVTDDRKWRSGLSRLFKTQTFVVSLCDWCKNHYQTTSSTKERLFAQDTHKSFSTPSSCKHTAKLHDLCARVREKPRFHWEWSPVQKKNDFLS